MCGFTGCVLFLFYSSQQPWEINHDIITSWHHPRFTTEGHWAIYPQRRRTTAKKPLLSARLVTMSDSQEKAEGRQLLMLNCPGSCPFSDGKCCREWLCHWSPALWCSLASQWPVNEQWTQEHSQVIVDFGLCSFCCQVHLRNSGSLGFPFCLFFFLKPHQEHSRQLKNMKLYPFQSRLETKMLTIFNAFVTSSPSGISLLWLMRNSWVWKHQIAENVLVAKSILGCWTLWTQFHKVARVFTWGYLSFETTLCVVPV